MLTDEQKARIVQRITILIPESEADENVLAQLADDSAAFVEGYTGRKAIPTGLEAAVGDLTIIRYNRMGTEGETARNEGGANLSFETAPQHIYDVLNRWRIARAGGVTHETAVQEG